MVLGWLLAVFLAPVLSAPRVGARGWHRRSRLAGAAARSRSVSSPSFWCGARAPLVELGDHVAGRVGRSSLLELFVPPLAVVITPFKLLLGALGVAWGLFDYPLTLRGIGSRQRFQFMRRHFSVVLGFGAAFSLLFWLPCLGIVICAGRGRGRYPAVLGNRAPLSSR